MAPTAGLSDQVTPGAALVTVAVNCWYREARRVTDVAARLTSALGCKVTTAEADLEGSAVLVAVTAIVCGAERVAGAAYRPPAEMAPTAGLSDQVTPGAALVTVAVNCWDREAPRVTEAGVRVTATS